MTYQNAQVTVDVLDVVHLLAGGTLVLDSVGVELIPSEEIYRISQKVRTRVNAGRRRAGRPPTQTKPS